MTTVDDKTVVDAIRRMAKAKPDKEAFVFVDKFYDRIALSRKYLWDMSRKFAAILKRHGLGKGDLVCNTLVNSPERLITTYGTMTAGAIPMHAQQLLVTGEDLFHKLKTSNCKSIIVDTGAGREGDGITFLDSISYKDESSGEVRYKDLPCLKNVIKLKVYSEEKEDPSVRWLRSLESEEEMFVEEGIREEDVAGLFNTSGTTGFAKLVPHTNPRMLFKGAKEQNFWDITEENVYYNNRPLGWFGGFPHLYNNNGCKTVIPNLAHGKPEDMASHMVRVFQEEKCDYANLAGIEVERILEKLDKPLSHQFKRILIGGGPVATYIKTAIGVITDHIIVVYGGTEFGAVSALLLSKGSTYESYCAGHQFPSVEMKILDANSQPVPKGTHGEIYVRSSMIADCYLNDPEKTKDSFLEDGWFRTNDIGYEDDAGFLFVLGRKANAIMKGSSLIYPGWLETKTLKCPGIDSVSIIGVPDPTLHEDVCMCIVKHKSADYLDEETVKKFCQQLFTTSENEVFTPVPRYFLFFDEFPFNTNLKVDRAVLKVEACKRLNIKL